MFEPLLVGIVFPLSGINHGSFKVPPRCTPWKGICIACGKKDLFWTGHLCASFANSVGGWMPCQQAWCPECFTSSDTESLHVDHMESGLGYDNKDADWM
jgi:hypothetical protein